MIEKQSKLLNEFKDFNTHTRARINEKNPVAFCDDIRKFSRNFANFSRKIAALHCVISGLAKKNEPAILVCKETAENGE